jgi:hypothetical protein
VTSKKGKVKREKYSFRMYLAAFGLLILASPTHVAAQEVTVDAKTDSSQIVMGNWFRLKLDIRHPKDVTVTMPILKDSLGPFTIVKEESLSVTEAAGTLVGHKEYVLSAFEPGVRTIPPMTVRYKTGSDTALHTAESSTLSVTIIGVEVDSTQGLKDIKAPLSLPLTWKEIALYAGILLALAGLVYGAFILYKRRKKSPAAAAEEEPAIPPHVLALERLRELEQRRLWQNGEIKGFYTEATEIVRAYFEARFGIMALEMTTDEIMAQMRRTEIERELLQEIELLFTYADLVKFAKEAPTPMECEAVVPRAREIVESTTLHETEPVNV